MNDFLKPYYLKIAKIVFYWMIIKWRCPECEFERFYHDVLKHLLLKKEQIQKADAIEGYIRVVVQNHCKKLLKDWIREHRNINPPGAGEESQHLVADLHEYHLNDIIFILNRSCLKLKRIILNTYRKSYGKLLFSLKSRFNMQITTDDLQNYELTEEILVTINPWIAELNNDIQNKTDLKKHEILTNIFEFLDKKEYKGNDAIRKWTEYQIDGIEVLLNNDNEIRNYPGISLEMKFRYCFEMIDLKCFYLNLKLEQYDKEREKLVFCLKALYGLKPDITDLKQYIPGILPGNLEEISEKLSILNNLPLNVQDQDIVDHLAVIFNFVQKEPSLNSSILKGWLFNCIKQIEADFSRFFAEENSQIQLKEIFVRCFKK